MSSPRAFRQDLEGLRGFAILLVVLFHAGVRGMEGAFVGVDVFFVLSGFFITGLLFDELDEKGTIDLTAFWGRRAIRLLPAMLAMVLVTIVTVMWLHAPIDRPGILSAARWVAASAGNVELARGAIDYFGTGDNPLLHTWSLGVEQQFYLVWPLLIIGIGLLAGRLGPIERPDRRWIVIVMLLVGAASFAASIVVTRVAQPWAFFGVATRLWEFVLGGLLALLMQWRREPNAGQSARAWPVGGMLQVAGSSMIVVALARFTAATPYPGWAALLPVAGSVALIAGGAMRGAFMTPILALSPFRWLGRVSYGWYLWHWPAIGLGVVLAPDIGAWGKVAIATATLPLAVLTYRRLERSARDGRLARIPHAWRPALGVAASAIVVLVAHAALRVAERQSATPGQTRFAAAREGRLDHGCWARAATPPAAACEFGDRQSTTTIVLLGDSHAEHWIGALDLAGRQRGWKIRLMVKGGCPVAELESMGHRRGARYYAECERYREARIHEIIAMQPAAVILSSWDHYLPRSGSPSPWQVDSAAWERGLRRTYQRMTSAGIRTIAIRDVPKTPFDAPGCLSRLAAKLPLATECTYSMPDALNRAAVNAQTRAAAGLPIRFISMNDQLCTGDPCAVVGNGEVVFTEDNHLTWRFSRTLAPVFAERLSHALTSGERRGTVSVP